MKTAPGYHLIISASATNNNKYGIELIIIIIIIWSTFSFSFFIGSNEKSHYKNIV